jgi:hypothetical protein
VESSGLIGQEAALYAVIPENGSTIGNKRAREVLGWSEEEYWKVRNSLEDKGLAARGPGKGGTTRRIVAAPSVDAPQVTVEAVDNATVIVLENGSAVRREEELYEPLAAVIKGDWAKDRRATPLAVEVTARQGRRATGGRWSRPDIVSIEVKTYEYVPGKFLEVVSFEVKPSDAIDVQAVYEALAHRRAATRCYVLLHVPSELAEPLQQAIQEVRVVARSHGVGIIVATDPAEYDTWEELEEAERFEPDPDRLNQFIEGQLSAKTKRQIARTLR